VTRIGSAIERSYREQREKLWRALLLFCGDREIASDAVAEAFAQLLRRGGAVRRPDRWVWRAAFSIARGELQRRGSWSTFMRERTIPARPPALFADACDVRRRATARGVPGATRRRRA